MKTSLEFNKRRSANVDNKMNDNKLLEKNNVINNNEIGKIFSSRNIEDEILDQNFKNYIKNDEILKTSLSKNNSLQNLNQDNDSNDPNYQNIYTINPKVNDIVQPAGRNKNTINKDNNKNNDINNNIQINKNIPSEMNTKSLFEDIQLLKTYSDNEYIITESASKNLVFNNDNNNSFDSLQNNDNENFERLKNDFFLLYSNEILNKVNNDSLFLEIQLMIEKIIGLQKKHQEEYINLLNSINIYQNLFKNNQNKYILLIKKINKLKVKKLYNDIMVKKKDLYNEHTIHKFINTRKKIMNTGEFMIWNKIIENTNKSQIINNNKRKIVNIFLNVCQKNENNLSKLSLKFYKELKNKKNIKISKNPTYISKKKSKLNYKSTFSEKKMVNIKTRLKDNETESNYPYLKTNQNVQNTIRIKLNRKNLLFSQKKKYKNEY